MPGSVTRDDARAYFASSGLSCGDMTGERLSRLHQALDAALSQSNSMPGLRILSKPVTHNGGPALGGTHQIRCAADHFENREAVTFNADGFIGLAGWADDVNIQPFIDGFCAWVDEIAVTPNASPGSNANLDVNM